MVVFFVINLNILIASNNIVSSEHMLSLRIYSGFLHWKQ